jgi:hypothetical protein
VVLGFQGKVEARSIGRQSREEVVVRRSTALKMWREKANTSIQACSYIYSFLSIILLVYCRYIVTFTKVLTIYHS